MTDYLNLPWGQNSSLQEYEKVEVDQEIEKLYRDQMEAYYHTKIAIEIGNDTAEDWGQILFHMIKVFEYGEKIFNLQGTAATDNIKEKSLLLCEMIR